jgi:hypothetical protein
MVAAALPGAGNELVGFAWLRPEEKRREGFEIRADLVLPDHVVGGTTGYGFEGGQNLVESGELRVDPPSSDFGATSG